MKFPFFKTLVLAGAMVVAWNCSHDSVVNVPGDPGAYYEDVKSLNLGDQTIYINDDNEVKDENGNIIGSFDPSTGEVINTQGEKIAENVNKDELENTQISTGDNSQDNQQGSNQQNEQQGNPQNPSQQSSDNTQGGQQNPTQGGQQGNSQGGQQDNTQGGQQQGGGNTQTVTSSDCNQNGITGCQTFNAYPGADVGKIVIPNANEYPQWGDWSMQDMFSIDWSYDKKEVTLTVKIPADKAAGTYTDVLKVGNKEIPFKITISGSASGGQQSGGQQTQSSNSQQQPQQPKSSSSQQQQQPKSSSSVSGGGQQTSGCPNISGTGNKDGFASRYWDGCKPSCSWKENSNGNPSRQCNANGTTQNYDYNAQSVCSGGGSAATCLSQVPFTVNGCDKYGFAFAAVPAGLGGACGKCFKLDFTGTGKYETKLNHQKLKGKSLIIMVTNVGTDVNGGQFDIMIPGGGVGMYNGVSGYGWGNQGETYGGLLSNCENEAGYQGTDQDIYERRKSCLINKCNSVFPAGDARNGCLFLANFMEAAGNPEHKYVEITCPDVLKSRY